MIKMLATKYLFFIICPAYSVGLQRTLHRAAFSVHCSVLHPKYLVSNRYTYTIHTAVRTTPAAAQSARRWTLAKAPRVTSVEV